MRLISARVVLALLLAMFLRAFVVQAFRAPSGSMAPSLQIGDHFFCSKSAYGVRIPGTSWVFGPRDPERGDIVVFRYPDDRSVTYVKRIVGLPGETIEIRNRQVYVDGVAIADPWGFCDDGRSVHDPSARCSASPRADDLHPTVIPDDGYFMLGDNRQRSQDSRYWTASVTVPRADLLGKVGRIYFARDWHRIGHRVE